MILIAGMEAFYGFTVCRNVSFEVFLPPAYVVRRECNIFSLSVHRGGGGGMSGTPIPVTGPVPAPAGRRGYP